MVSLLFVLLIYAVTVFFFWKKQWFKFLPSALFTVVFLIAVIFVRFFSGWIVSVGYGYNSLPLGNETSINISEVNNFIEKGGEQVPVGDLVFIDSETKIIYFIDGSDTVGINYSMQKFSKVFVPEKNLPKLLPVNYYFKHKMLYFNFLTVLVFCVLYSGLLQYYYEKNRK
jgi:hypothetical protein